MSTNWIIPLMLTFVITAIIAPRLLPILKRLKFGQHVRDDGPQTHLKKQGTPTMGGVIFIIGIVIAAFIWGRQNGEMLIVLLTMLSFGIIGFLDDWLKIKKTTIRRFVSKTKIWFTSYCSTCLFIYWTKNQVVDNGNYYTFCIWL